MAKRLVVKGLGDRLQKARKLGDCPARELDRIADTTEGHTSLIESGVVKNVTAETVAKLARALGVTTDWLITGQGQEPAERAVRAAVDAARVAWAKSHTKTSAA